MKFRCETQQLKTALTNLNKTVPGKTTLPVLEHVLCEVNERDVRLSATDLTRWVNITIDEVDDLEPGSVLIPARLFSRFASTCSDNKITVNLEGLTLNLTTDHHDVRIKCKHSEEFPLPSAEKLSAILEIPAGKLSRMVKKVEYASGNAHYSEQMSGIFNKAEQDKLTMAATDGYRLAVCSSNVEMDDDFTALVPSSAMREWARLCSEGTVIMRVYNREQISFETARMQMTTLQIAGDFPNYTAVIPDSFMASAQVDTTELTRALKVAHLFAQSNENDVAQFEIVDGALVISGTAPESGGDVTRLKALKKGRSVTIQLNSKYVLGILNSIDSDETRIEVGPDARAVTFKPVGDSQQLAVLAVVSPMC